MASRSLVPAPGCGGPRFCARSSPSSFPGSASGRCSTGPTRTSGWRCGGSRISRDRLEAAFELDLAEVDGGARPRRVRRVHLVEHRVRLVQLLLVVEKANEDGRAVLLVDEELHADRV